MSLKEKNPDRLTLHKFKSNSGLMSTFLFSLSLLFLSSPAQAHRPHAVAKAYANSIDFEISGVAWAIIDPHDVSQLMRSEDFGRHWDYQYSPATDDSLVDAEDTLFGLLLLGKDGSVWQQNEEGEWLDHNALDVGGIAREFEVIDGELYVASSIGLYHAPISDLSSFSRMGLASDLVSIHTDGGSTGTILAVDAGGAIWRAEGPSSMFERFSPLSGGRNVLSVTEYNGRVFAGTNQQVAASDDNGDSWIACGSMPISTGNDYVTHIVEIVALPNGRLIAANAREGLFVSDDSCESWSYMDTGVWVPFGGIGNAVDPQEGVVYIGMTGDVGTIATFSGITSSVDGGNSWHETKLLPGDFSRSISISPDFPFDSRIFTGGYGGGAFWTDDGGLSWEGSATGLVGPYTYDVLADPNIGDNDHVYYSGSTWPHESFDGGYTWSSVDNIPMERVRNYRAQGHRVWAIGEDDTQGLVGKLAFTVDQGASWEEVPSLYDTWDGAVPRDVFETDDMIAVVVDMPAGMLISTDDGDSWLWVHEGALETAGGGALWVDGETTRLLFASPTSGIIYSNDNGTTWNNPETPPTGRPRLFDQADDGTLLVVNRAGQVFLSIDGGLNWEPSGEPMAPAPYAISTAPNFQETGIAVVSTTGGTFWTNSRGESWAQLPRYSRFEQGTYHIDCHASGGDEHEECDTYEDHDQGFMGGYLLQEGDTLDFSFSGDTFSILGVGEGDGMIAVYIDGVEVEELTGDGTKLYSGPHSGPNGGVNSGGWKDITLVVTQTSGEGLHIDAIEVFGDGDPLPIPTSGDTGDDTGDDTGGDNKDTCGGCSSQTSDSGLPLLLLIALGLVNRRRT